MPKMSISWLARVTFAITLGVTACGSNSATSTHADSGLGDGTTGSSSGAVAPRGDGGLHPGVLGGVSDGGVNTSCLGLGSACTTGGECCSGDCASGVCSYPVCTPDGNACTSNGECCSQACTGGTCAALNTTCKTIGNTCSSSTDCCSARCATNGTCQASSFCAQPGDACSTGGQCCTGICTVAAGLTLGTCATSPPTKSANCKLADGQLCSGGAGDGGAVYWEGGLPACGGGCCSRACAPFGPTGVLICQPASGCHVVGDLCTKDSDCCGSAGLPGGSGKPVTCTITPPNTVGVCRNPNSCKPDGDVCRLATNSCNASCDCCSGNCHDNTCLQDNLGVPRCAGPQCVNPGGACASSANCCNGMPCVPNASGTPPYVCAPTVCIAACGACTNNADCCPGTLCIASSGSTSGTCGPCGGNGPSPDGGPPPPPPADGGPPPPPPDGGCAVYGQVCVTNADCCNNVPCTNGRCEQPIF